MNNNVIQKYAKGGSAVKIAEGLEAAIREDALAPGQLLPPVRELAALLGVSPGTAAAAYRKLHERGLIATAGRRGTRVSPRPTMAHRAPAPLPAGVVDLANGSPDPRLLPDLSGALARIETEPVLYDRGLIHPRLEKATRKSLAKDGIPNGPLTVTGGAMDALERVLRERLRPGDRVAVEDPGFSGVFDLVSSLSLGLAGVELDEEGMRPEALGRVLEEGVGAVILTPRAQNPTGAALTESRAGALAEVLRRHPEVTLIEDDHAWEAAGAPAVTLSTRGIERWVLVRSASKALGPDLRLAIMTGDDQTLGRIRRRQSVGMRWVSHLLQQIVAGLLEDRAVRSQLRRAAKAYAARREALIRALANRGFAAVGRSGMNVWIPVTEEAPVIQALMADGWAVTAGERFRLSAGPAIRVTISQLEVNQADLFAESFERAVQSRVTTQPV